MAKILLGATIGDARGSAGAIVYSKNRSGAYIRQKVSPVQPQTARQTLVRQQFSSFSIRWSTVLTEAQRTAWIALAATYPVVDVFGNSQILTGLQLYLRVNSNLVLTGTAVLDTAPPNQDVTPLSALSINATSGVQLLEVGFGPSPVPADHSLVVFAAAAGNPGKVFYKPGMRFLEVFPATSASAVDATASYIAKFGAIPLGQRIAVKAFNVNVVVGRASAPMFATGIVAA